MANAFDVAQYILEEKGEMSAMKLQKLVYYSQAWSTVWDDDALFQNKIEAWANGPVVRDLYDQHRGNYRIDSDTFAGHVSQNADEQLTEEQTDTINHVLRHYGDKSAQWLSNQTHIEQPWLQAREGLADLERGDEEITTAAMAEYYSSL